uniref:Bromo domain-containing protein n=1 Tax=Mandrillus leucophaeus TaxID=9568 RepID=A0A2K5Z8I1_MANLE
IGKKHKQHKSDKHLYEEYVEKPLKLVLKVGGNEATELSTSSSGHDSSLFEDKNDHDKHKDRKQKKRKKGEKVKEDKKKRDRDRVEKKAEKDLQCHASVRLDVPHEKPLTSTLAKKEQTPLQEALNQLERQLQRKDPSAYFSFPVTDFTKEKIKNNDYGIESIEELNDNFKLMCTNAMIYNKPETTYYKAAKKLLHSGMKILSQERIQSLKQSIDFMADLQKTRKVERTEAASQERTLEMPKYTLSRVPAKKIKRKTKICLKIKSRSSLTREFERRKSDRTTMLGLLHPVDPTVGELRMTTGRLQYGVNTLQGFKEDKRNKVTPVLYLNYGSYSSYAPHYDSTYASISKDDSNLIYSTYGEDPDLPSDFSIHEFLATCQDYPYVIADSLLDVLTKGGHSRTLCHCLKVEGHTRTLDTAEEMGIKEVEPPGCLDSNTQDRLIALKAVTNFGIPVEVFDSEEAEIFQKKLDETTRLLRELTPSQHDLTCTASNSTGDIVTMGISIPSPVMANNFVDLTEDTEELKKTNVAWWKLRPPGI